MVFHLLLARATRSVELDRPRSSRRQRHVDVGDVARRVRIPMDVARVPRAVDRRLGTCEAPLDRMDDTASAGRRLGAAFRMKRRDDALELPAAARAALRGAELVDQADPRAVELEPPPQPLLRRGGVAEAYFTI